MPKRKVNGDGTCCDVATLFFFSDEVGRRLSGSNHLLAASREWGMNPINHPSYLGELYRPHTTSPQMVVYVGNSPQPPYFRLVKYYNSARSYGFLSSLPVHAQLPSWLSFPTCAAGLSGQRAPGLAGGPAAPFSGAIRNVRVGCEERRLACLDPKPLQTQLGKRFFLGEVASCCFVLESDLIPPLKGVQKKLNPHSAAWTLS